jgi:hypothetical protein
MNKIEEKLETVLKQLEYISKSEYIKGLDFYNIDSSINKLCDYLVDLMVASDKYDIYETESDNFLDNILRGEGWVGYHNLDTQGVINEFDNRTFTESPDDFVDELERLIKNYYWREDAYNKHSAETLIQETIYQLAELVNNVVGTMKE